MMLGCRTRRSTATSFSIRCSCPHTPDGLSDSRPCHISPQKMAERSQLTFPQQRALSMIFSAYSCPVDLPIIPASATPRCEKKTLFPGSSHAPHLSTHSLTTAKFPSPMTLPIWYFSLMRGEEMERLPFTARTGREEGSKLSKIQELFLKHPPRTAEQSSFYTRAPSPSSACSAAPLTSVEEVPRGVYGEKGSNVKPRQVVQKTPSKVLQRP